jgi:hypothetical protein
MQPLPGVTEGCFKALTFTGSETIERDREEMDTRD